MKRFVRHAVAIVAWSGATACFHQVVQTGSPPGSTVVDKQYVATWLWGIVPAQPIDVRQQCPSGVATIETEQTFLDGLVGLLTIGIYTPQHARVTCASGSASLPDRARELVVPKNVSDGELTRIVSSAVQETIATGTPTVIRF